MRNSIQVKKYSPVFHTGLQWVLIIKKYDVDFLLCLLGLFIERLSGGSHTWLQVVPQWQNYMPISVITKYR